ncbi:hypothetical protein JBKA6_0653 [Ichthyobacterium seriolicida]|uniref:Uncharacterized protein n=2 Tax=Ichthyobacterium seriolicida TaxID=242600 RepID=A0A1J1DXS1_9FLAO|nr:hypothetical protein JBKA6_0653 [Ichthyobacterium seriolicida]
MIHGKGPQKGIDTHITNHYLMGGLVPIHVPNPYDKISDTEKDFSINIQVSFVDFLVRALTVGFYTPTTTTITK